MMRPYTIVRRPGKPGMELYVRKYEGGEVSPLIHKIHDGDSIEMSGPRGVGLHLDDTSSGVVVGVALGTCSFTYYDLIQYLVAKYEYEKEQGIRLEEHQNVYLSRATLHRAASMGSLHQTSSHRMSPHGAAAVAPAHTPMHGGTLKDADIFLAKGSSAADILHATNDIGPQSSPKRMGMRRSSDVTAKSSGNESVVGVDDPDKLLNSAHVPFTSGKGRAYSGSSVEGAGATSRGDSKGSSDSSLRLQPMAVAGRRNSLPSAPHHKSGAGRKMQRRSAPTDDDLAASAGVDVQAAKRYVKSQRASVKTSRLITAEPSEVESSSDSEDANGTDKKSFNDLKLVLLVVFGCEDEVLEAEWLLDAAQKCPYFELHINIKRKALGSHPLHSYENLHVGRVDDKQLAAILPPRDLLGVTLCGSNTFVTSMKEMYLSMGMPRGIVTAV